MSANVLSSNVMIDASTNTDPLNIKIYVDDDGRIKWKFKDEINVANVERKTDNTNITNITNNITNNNDPNVIINANNTNTDMHLIEELFVNAFLINCLAHYEFPFTTILDPNSNYQIKYQNSFDNFDYMMLSNGNECLKSDLWSTYNLQPSMQKKYGELIHSGDESACTARIIEAIYIALGKNMEKCLIILNDKCPPMNIFLHVKELLQDDKKCIAIGKYNSNDSSNPLSINAFMLDESIYTEFLDDLNEANTTWRMILLKYIQSHYFTSTLLQYDNYGEIH